MFKRLTSLVLFSFLACLLAVALVVEPADAYPSMGSNCASCHKDTTTTSQPATKPASNTGSGKATSTSNLGSAVKLTVEGKEVKAYKSGNKVFAAIKEYADAMKYKLTWDAQTQSIILEDFNNKLVINTKKGTVNYRGKDHQIASVVKNGVSYIDIEALTNLTHGKFTFANGVYTVRKSATTLAWENSPHNFSVEGVTQDDPAARDGCANCHNGAAFPNKRMADINNEVTPITCNTCHGQTKAVADLKGKKPYVLPNGLQVDGGAGTVCINCHNGRRDTSNVEALYASYRAPHVGPQSDLYFATGGFKFGDKDYGSSPHNAIENTCVTCHMAPADDPYGPVGGHTFKIVEGDKENINACKDCHPDMTTIERRALGDYDGDKKVESFQAEVEGLQHLLKEAIIAKYAHLGVIDIVESHGSIVYATDLSDPEHPVGLEPGVVSLDDYKATWNLILTEQDGSKGIHNPIYTVQLLQQSYKAVTGKDVPNAVIR